MRPRKLIVAPFWFLLWVLTWAASILDGVAEVLVVTAQEAWAEVVHYWKRK